MTLRTHRETLTFAHPFTLSGVEDVQAPGAYMVQTDEELLEGLSFLAYRRVATVIFVPLRHGGRLAAGDHGRPARARGCVGERRIPGGPAVLMSTAVQGPGQSELSAPQVEINQAALQTCSSCTRGSDRTSCV
jgi:hypothetical protein